MTPAQCAELAVNKMIEDTTIPYLAIELLNTKPSIFESKLGGLPYLPKNAEIPIDSKGRQMKLLAQINCNDISELEDYPHEGILQFWLTIDFRWKEAKVKYYKNIDKTISENDILPLIENYDDGDFPVNGEYGIRFTLKNEYISRDDERFEALFCQYYTEISGKYIMTPENDGDEVYEIYECFSEDMWSGCSKVGGYRGISQLPDYITYLSENANIKKSPYRKYVSHIDLKSDDAEILLLQLDSWYNNSTDYQMMWGDAGIAQFHITRKDLRERNFNNVTFHWDCS